MPPTRRQFFRKALAATGSLAAVPALASLGQPERVGANAPTAGSHRASIADVLAALRGMVPDPLPPDTVDTLKLGDPDRACTGIVTTFMATVPVIEETARRGANLIVTHEPTFYNHRDETDFLADDPVYAGKLALLERHGIAVFRFHDGYHRLSPDPMFEAFVRSMGWTAYAEASEIENAVVFPEATSLSSLARALARRLRQPRVEYVGDADYPCRRVGILPGAWGRERQIEFLSSGEIDVLVVGEAAEWEAVEYARDAQALGLGRALIVVGHAVSEDPGVVQLAAGLLPRVSGVAVSHVAAGDPLRPV